MHNKLRRAIEHEQHRTYDEPHLKISAQSVLLQRALIALGGTVTGERPPQETVVSPAIVLSEAVPVDMVGLVNPDQTTVLITDVHEHVSGLGDSCGDEG